jgi:hypothetical protein
LHEAATASWRLSIAAWRSSTVTSLCSFPHDVTPAGVPSDARESGSTDVYVEPLTTEFLLGLEGVGWGGDLDALRRDKPDEFA